MDEPAVKYLSNIVITGAFNPSIIQPAWLISTGIVSPPSDDEEVSIEMPVVSPSLVFRFEIGQVKWTVATDRLILEPKNGKPVQTLAISVLKKLFHTPLTAVGTNVESVIPREVWKSDKPVISAKINKACGEFGEVNERGCSLKINRDDNVTLTIIIKEEMDASENVIINLNFHQNTPTLKVALDALSNYEKHTAEAKTIVSGLIGAMN